MDSSDGWTYRLLLFTPDHRLDWVGKTPRYVPDAVILDPEGAASPHEKVGARGATHEGSVC